MLRFYWRLIKRTPVLLWRALTGLDKVAGVLTLLFGVIGIGAWRELFPLWTPFAAFGVILLYGFLRANYEDHLVVEAARDKATSEKYRLRDRLSTVAKRKAVKDLLAEAADEGKELRGYVDRTRREIKIVPHPDIEDWIQRTHDFIEAAFDKGEARHFLSGEGYRQEGLSPADNLYLSRYPHAVPVRLWRLDQLIIRANELPINPDFDPEEWKDHFKAR